MRTDHQTLFDEMAIAVRRGEGAPYVFGDRLDGFYEGRTFRLAEGAGYQVHGRAIFRDYLSWRGNLPNPRDRAEGAQIGPVGARHQHSAAMWDELVVLPRRRALALRLRSGRADRLAFAPLLELSAAENKVEYAEGLALIGAPRGALFIGVSSHQLFRPAQPAPHESLFAPVFHTAQPENEFVLYLAFASSAERAVEQARRLREGDALEQHERHLHESLVRSTLWTDDEDFGRALLWAKLSSWLMLAGDEGDGFWAGLPWHRDHRARETLLALPGALLAAGHFHDARTVLRRAASRVELNPKSDAYGLLPDRLAGPEPGGFLAADSPLLFVRALHAYLAHTGDADLAGELLPAVAAAVEGGGKRADKDGFLAHDPAGTWMHAPMGDGQIWTPRGNRAVEIQGLWHDALLAAAALAAAADETKRAAAWRKAAGKVASAFPKKFVDARKKRVADFLPAQGAPDYRVRPNALLAIALPDLAPPCDAKTAAAILAAATAGLITPHGVLSLAADDPFFHPQFENPDHYHREAARHHGAIHGWLAGPAIHAFVQAGHRSAAWILAHSMATQMLKSGHRGTLAEMIDGLPGPRGKTVPGGCWAHTPALGEFIRAAFRDLGGFRPDLPAGRLRLAPVLPEDCGKFSATLPFGRSGQLTANFVREKGRDVWMVAAQDHPAPVTVEFSIPAFGKLHRFEWELKPGDTAMAVFDGKTVTAGLNGRWQPSTSPGQPMAKEKALKLAAVPAAAGRKVLAGTHVLREAITAARTGVA
jgi:glycogen debranching enzyme